MNHCNRYSRWSLYIGISILFAGLLLLLGTVLMCDMRHLIVGEQAYQRLCLGYAAIAFAVCALIYCCFIRSEKHSSVFYMSAIEALILVGGVVRTYQFAKNYYFVSGDNMLNSQDSRYWGMLPEEYIVGKVTRIWNSKDTNTGKTRWERVMKKVD